MAAYQGLPLIKVPLSCSNARVPAVRAVNYMGECTMRKQLLTISHVEVFDVGVPGVAAGNVRNKVNAGGDPTSVEAQRKTKQAVTDLEDPISLKILESFSSVIEGSILVT